MSSSICLSCLHTNCTCDPWVNLTQAEREVMEDYVLNCIHLLTPKEIAQAIKENITTLEKVEATLYKS